MYDLPVYFDSFRLRLLWFGNSQDKASGEGGGERSSTKSGYQSYKHIVTALLPFVSNGYRVS